MPTLAPGDDVVLDNLSSRGQSGAGRFARARLFFLPPYSPDLNPIEQAFAKLKNALGNTASRAHRRYDIHAIAAAIKTLTSRMSELP